MSNQFDVDIYVNGKSIKQYTHKSRVFVEAKHGTEYSIHIRNPKPERILVVCTVDGINVLNGEAGDKSKAGYVVNGYSSVDIKGFRTSNDSVNAFKFSTKNRSYAAKSDATGGDTSNCGVIGVKVFAEKVKPTPITKIIQEHHHHHHDHWKPYVWPVYPKLSDITWTSCSSVGGLSSNTDGGMLRCFNASAQCLNDAAPMASASAGNLITSNFLVNSEPQPNFDMGTEWSKNAINDKVYDVEFEVGRILGTSSIFYASREALESMGVQFYKQTQVSFPDPFPSRFCKPPRD